ncbi:NAR1 ribosyltransferase, partial [Certhia brachydactyla]|nr:NAR1 ribosyltransferase [Certhia brachydactyla]
ATTSVLLPLVPLDMSPSSFDDQYQGCVPAMTAALPALNRSEFQNNPLFAHTWQRAAAAWRARGSPVSPLSPSQAIAIMAYTMDDTKLYREFNAAVRAAGSSRREYLQNFHFKTLHFLLTRALGTLRDAQRGPRCHRVFRGVAGLRFEARLGARVRLGHFASASLSQPSAGAFGVAVTLQVWTCHGAAIREFSFFPHEDEVLIPPHEAFRVTRVTNVTGTGDNGTRIELRSAGSFSKYNCEWLRGDSDSWG